MIVCVECMCVFIFTVIVLLIVVGTAHVSMTSCEACRASLAVPPPRHVGSRVVVGSCPLSAALVVAGSPSRRKSGGLLQPRPLLERLEAEAERIGGGDDDDADGAKDSDADGGEPLLTPHATLLPPHSSLIVAHSSLLTPGS